MGSYDLELEIIPFEPKHYFALNPATDDKWLGMVRTAAEESDAFTACILGDPVGCAGVRIIQSRYGEAWACFTPVIKRLPLGLFKAVKTRLDKIITNHDLITVVAICGEHDLTAQRFLEHLGFPKEGRKLAYTRVTHG